MSDDATPNDPFSVWITDHARGTVDDEMTAALMEVTQVVSALGKKGSVLLRVDIEPAGSGGRTVSTACLVQAKPPLPNPEQSIFFVGEGGRLLRDDPYQLRAQFGPGGHQGTLDSEDEG